MEYFFFSDIHGEFDDLMKALKESGFTGGDKQMLVSLGDNFDRGPKSKELLYWLSDQLIDEKLLSVRGNHDCNLNTLLTGKRAYDNKVDTYNGVLETLSSFADTPLECRDYTPIEIQSIIASISGETKMRFQFLFKESSWAVRNKNYIGVHGWFPGRAGLKTWEDAVWAKTDAIVAHPQWYLPHNPNIKVIIGHWYTGYLKQIEDAMFPQDHVVFVPGKPFFSRTGRIIGLDGATNVFHHVNVFRIQVDDDNLFYPFDKDTID